MNLAFKTMNFVFANDSKCRLRRGGRPSGHTLEGFVPVAAAETLLQKLRLHRRAAGAARLFLIYQSPACFTDPHITIITALQFEVNADGTPSKVALGMISC